MLGRYHILCLAAITLSVPLQSIESGSITKVTPATPKSTKQATRSKLEIKKFRFARHKRKNYERLVIQFAKKEEGAIKPQVRLIPNASGKDASISVDNILLVGAIPESAINDSYVPHSKYFGPVSLNTDDPSTGLAVRLFLKEASSTPRAFWLEKPSRLVVDVYPPKAQQVALGRGTTPREIAMESTKDDPKNALSKEFELALGGKVNEGTSPPESFLGHSTNTERILCFPASSQMAASVSFHPKSAGLVPIKMEVPSVDANEKSDRIVCYPLSAQMVPQVGYQAKPGDVQVQPPTQLGAASPPSVPQTVAPQLGIPQLGAPQLGAPMTLPQQGFAPSNSYGTPNSAYTGGGVLNLGGPMLGQQGGVARSPSSVPPLQLQGNSVWPSNPPPSLGAPLTLQPPRTNTNAPNPAALLQRK